MDLSDLTLVVHTRGARQTLSSGLSPALKAGVQLLIMNNGVASWGDSLKHEFPSQVCEVIETGKYLAQISSGPDLVQTKYMMHVDDDAVVLPSGLNLALTTLRHSSNIQVIVGVPLVLKNLPWGLQLESNPHRQLNHSLDFPDGPAGQRLRDLSHRWRSRSWYGVYETTAIQPIMHVAAQIFAETSCPSAAEVGVELLERGLLRAAGIPFAFNVRSLVAASHSDETFLRHLSYHSWRHRNSFAQEVEWFDRTISSILRDKLEESRMRAVLENVANDRMDFRDKERLIRAKLATIFKLKPIRSRSDTLIVSRAVTRRICDPDTEILRSWAINVTRTHM